MAIKGKKKAQQRSKAKRRPGGAPRVQYSHHEHIPWYQTSGGRVGIAVGLVLLIGIIAAVVVTVTREPQADVRAQGELEGYTTQVGAVLFASGDAGAGLAQAPTASDDDAFAGLEKDAGKWVTALKSAQLTAAQVPSPRQAPTVAELFQSSLGIYLESARLYELAAGAEGKDADRLLKRAAAKLDLATTVWTNALVLLDEARTDVDLPSSALTSPVAVIPGNAGEATPDPTPEATTEVTPKGDGNN